MPLFLRVIRRERWYYQEYKTKFPWLQEDEFPGDLLGDLRTSDNQLSVFYIEDGDDISTVEKIAVAYAAIRDKPDNVDYALIDSQILDELGLRTAPTPGVTPDNQVNTWHRDIVELSAQKLVRLASAMLPHDERRGRILKKTIEQRLMQIDVAKIQNPKMKEELEKLRASH